MLLPECEDQDALAARLDRVRRRYAAVQRRLVAVPRLHDEPARFYLERLRGVWRSEPWVRSLAERAVECFRHEIDKARSFHPRLSDLAEDQNYQRASERAIAFLPWVKEDEACQLQTLRFLEGAAHHPSLQRSVLRALAPWRPSLADRSKRRLGILEQGAADAAS